MYSLAIHQTIALLDKEARRASLQFLTASQPKETAAIQPAYRTMQCPCSAVGIEAGSHVPRRS